VRDPNVSERGSFASLLARPWEIISGIWTTLIPILVTIFIQNKSTQRNYLSFWFLAREMGARQHKNTPEAPPSGKQPPPCVLFFRPAAAAFIHTTMLQKWSSFVFTVQYKEKRVVLLFVCSFVRLLKPWTIFQPPWLDLEETPWLEASCMSNRSV
jgi:hypothetical protein